MEKHTKKYEKFREAEYDKTQYEVQPSRVQQRCAAEQEDRVSLHEHRS